MAEPQPQDPIASIARNTTRRRLLGAAGAVAVLSPLGLAGCGGSREEPANIRFINATLDFGNLSVQLEGDTLATLQPGEVTGFIGINDKEQTLRVKADGLTLLEVGIDPGKRSHTTVLLFSSAGSLQLTLFEEGEPAPGNGECKVRVFNASDHGNLDLFLTSATGDINTLPPAISSAAEQQFTGYAQISSGSRRLRLTRTGDRSDVRLDVGAVDFPSEGVITIVVMPTRSGRLLQAVALVQKGSSTPLPNPAGRVVFVNALVGTSAAPLIDGVLQPVVAGGGAGATVDVTAGSHVLGFSINGVPVTQQRTIVAATDTTCVVYGDAASPQIAFFDDDNQSATVGTQVKLRLANFATGVANATLLVDLSSVGSPVAFAGASSYARVNIGERDLAVNPSAGTAAVALIDQTLILDGVYTLFLLGTAASQQLVLRRDR